MNDSNSSSNRQNIGLFGNTGKVHFQDVLQGELGNCSFLSAVSSIAYKYPKQCLFKMQNISKNIEDVSFWLPLLETAYGCYNHIETQLDISAEDNGIFWIPLQDFKENFQRVNVCQLNPNYHQQGIQLQFKKEHQMKVAFQVYEDQTDITLSLVQQDKKFFDQVDQYRYGLSKFMVVKDDFSKWVDEKYSVNQITEIKVTFYDYLMIQLMIQ
ncbi:hypothetical protein PPERSA_09854 [Pseudocohnilembus persalinus]|uniref:Calpain catalytic domain-containing protein n=1 Tax=Pseudocohnilembus persalinus TaxID=266149 RepID=A0A0V0QTX9_PSEPJ|nr:hypothetical protein PPERSA_09854 [Pseudocohnilembus persalinus]|eukprot:KRX05714.1 hypothetical protein PPERSA_09854 [Pseudocohnilembus persalinus]